jgi:parvulin-like peptidyl-prolyl isomerase
MRERLSDSKTRSEFAAQYAEMRILANEGRRRRIDADPKTAARIRYGNDQAMAAAFTEHLVEHAPVTDREIRRFYDDNAASFERIRGQQIVVKFAHCDPDTALAKVRELRRRLQTGEDFASVARREAGATGGEIDLSFGVGDPDLLASLRAARPGELSEPIRTAEGYHLVLVRDKRRQEYLDVRDAIEKKLRPEFARRAIDEIKRNAGIKLDPRYFGNS